MKIPEPSQSISSIRRDEDNDSQQNVGYNQFLNDTDYIAGLFCLTVSLGLFLLFSSTSNAPASPLSGSHIVNYLIAVFYFIWLLTTGKMKFFWKAQKKEFQAHRLLLWLVWLVSCFALNRSIEIFNESAQWLSIAIFLSASACIAYRFENYLTSFFKNTLYLFLGISTILWLYFAIYLSNLYPISIPAIFVFGFSIHSFIPLMLFIALVRILYQKWKSFNPFILTGLIVPLLIAVYFSFQWHAIIYKIRYANNDIATKTTEELPSWVVLGQTIGNDWITERVLKGKLVYQIPGPKINFMPRDINSGELYRHDPLVVIASLFSPKIDLEPSDRIKLLDVLFDARHYTQERLWSGKNLTTENVITQAKIYPEYRLAYTEKTISIGNQSDSQWSQQEALYSFYLPEGSVVSSLSLWINGKEEKGYLTSHTKADSAYKTIVGVESRDPSVIHWQEGNTVKVKVFPCTPKENRRFKIGVTSPLRSENNELVYENIYFQGPASDEATETIRMDFSQNTNNIQLPFNTERIEKKGISARGNYRPAWKARFEAPPLSSGGFTFNGKSYSVKPYKLTPEYFDTKTVYLDINSSWTQTEFDELYHLLKNKAVYIYEDRFTKLTDKNKDQIFEELSAKRYTIFPVHKIKDSNTSLLITKGTPTSPNLSGLRESQFGNEIKNNLSDQPVIRTFNIGSNPSPYFKTLKEMRIVHCENAAFDEIKKLLYKKQFPSDPEADTTNNKPVVRIENAKMMIVESDQNSISNAPDHLLRLFAYNHIMKQIGRNYLSQSYLKASEVNTTLIDEAEKANIVTPVSSLIVLESQADYNRFGIKKRQYGLDNATMKNSGAVPEPHEWILILLFGLLVTYYTFRTYVR